MAASLEQFESAKLKEAIEATFKARGSYSIPTEMPAAPARISASYRQLARELDLPWPTIKEAGQAAAQFLNLVLKESSHAKWNAVNGDWA